MYKVELEQGKHQSFISLFTIKMMAIKENENKSFATVVKSVVKSKTSNKLANFHNIFFYKKVIFCMCIAC
jgi:hypothetical protein